MLVTWTVFNFNFVLSLPVIISSKKYIQSQIDSLLFIRGLKPHVQTYLSKAMFTKVSLLHILATRYRARSCLYCTLNLMQSILGDLLKGHGFGSDVHSMFSHHSKGLPCLPSSQNLKMQYLSLKEFYPGVIYSSGSESVAARPEA